MAQNLLVGVRVPKIARREAMAHRAIQLARRESPIMRVFHQVVSMTPQRVPTPQNFGHKVLQRIG